MSKEKKKKLLIPLCNATNSVPNYSVYLRIELLIMNKWDCISLVLQSHCKEEEEYSHCSSRRLRVEDQWRALDP